MSDDDNNRGTIESCGCEREPHTCDADDLEALKAERDRLLARIEEIRTAAVRVDRDVSEALTYAEFNRDVGEEAISSAERAVAELVRLCEP